jgi:hypothetical protein
MLASLGHDPLLTVVCLLVMNTFATQFGEAAAGLQGGFRGLCLEGTLHFAVCVNYWIVLWRHCCAEKGTKNRPLSFEGRTGCLGWCHPRWGCSRCMHHLAAD